MASRLIAKRAAPQVSLGVLFLAAQAVDILFMSLVLLGVERLRLTPDFTAFNDLELIFLPYSHSLVAAAVWGLVCGVAAQLLLKNRAAALTIGNAVGSHYFVDLVPFVPPPPSSTAFALQALVAFFGLAAWARWVDRAVSPQPPPAR